MESEIDVTTLAKRIGKATRYPAISPAQSKKYRITTDLRGEKNGGETICCVSSGLIQGPCGLSNALILGKITDFLIFLIFRGSSGSCFSHLIIEALYRQAKMQWKLNIRKQRK